MSSEEVRKGRPDVEEKQAWTTGLVPSHSRPAQGPDSPETPASVRTAGRDGGVARGLDPARALRGAGLT